MDKYSSIIVTAGISLFNKSNIYGCASDHYEAFEFDRTNPLLKVGHDLEDTLKNWKNEMFKKNRKGKEKQISAEYSLLYALKTNNELTDSPNVTLFHTAVDGNKIGGYFSAQLLSDILQKDFHAKVKLEQLDHFSVDNRTELKKSITGFMSKVVNALRDTSDENSTFFAPIGGYKVMTSYGYLAGSFVGYPTGYLHEDNQVLHIIPPVPIALDENFIEKYKDLLRELIFKDIVVVNDEDRPYIYKAKFLFEFAKIDKKLHVSLNPLGKFLLEKKYPHYFSYKIYLDKDIKLNSFIVNQIKTLLEKAKDENLSQRNKNHLNHQTTFKHKQNVGEYHLYKGSQGKQVFRALWKIDTNNKELWIPKVLPSHDKYEKDIAKDNKFNSYLQNKTEDKSKEYYEILNQK